MKEVNYSAYGQATLGSTPGRATDQQIKSGVDRAIKKYWHRKRERTNRTKRKIWFNWWCKHKCNCFWWRI